MADWAEVASDLTEFYLRLAHRRLAPRPVRASAQFCDDCGDPIPLDRQIAAAGCDTCIDCQQLRERRR